ncbi:STAS domain-containing protein [Sphaerisporangium sp. NPDC088356]|uniref:STAS domain-containing protein n=1 Tax=Sphaerisporangium sp. NPDC088356 TaxID=3154871 RepID=UPI00341B6496
MDTEHDSFFALPGTGAVVIRATGNLDFSSTPALRDKVETAASAAQATTVIIDLSEVGLCDSSGLGELLHARRRCETSGIQLMLAGPPPNVRRRLATTGLTALFEVFPSVTDALHHAG